jgi:hypothetical protein
MYIYIYLFIFIPLGVIRTIDDWLATREEIMTAVTVAPYYIYVYLDTYIYIYI